LLLKLVIFIIVIDIKKHKSTTQHHQKYSKTHIEKRHLCLAVFIRNTIKLIFLLLKIIIKIIKKNTIYYLDK